MKLIIQIPCYNEAGSLPTTLADLPREVAGFSAVEWMVIDDGSTDDTAAVAKAHGVDHIIRLPNNQGLARAFAIGIEAALRARADVIVNTDADNQYCADDLPALVAPILAGRAQIVVGARPIAAIEDFSAAKRLMQRLGSWAVRKASGTNIPDAPSGFRAIHRVAAAQLYVHDTFTYTLDTIIQAGRKNIPITWIDVRVNPPLRPSRLFRSTAGYVFRQGISIIRIFVLYKPFRFLTFLAFIVALPGIIGIARFLAFYVAGDGSGHIQSLILSSALIGLAAVLQMGAVLADIVAANRRLLEDIRSRQLLAETDPGPPDVRRGAPAATTGTTAEI